MENKISSQIENKEISLCVICKENPAREYCKTCSKKCSKAYQKAYRKTEKYRAYQKAYYEKQKSNKSQ